MGITIIPDEAFPRTRGDRPTEVDGNLIDRMVPPHTRGTANSPACRGLFPGLFGHGSSVSKKSNDFTPEGLHNTTLSDVKTGIWPNKTFVAPLRSIPPLWHTVEYPQ